MNATPRTFQQTVAQAYGFHIYDALVVASALEADCDTLYTEDPQNGQIIEERLTIRNPFTAPSDGAS